MTTAKSVPAVKAKSNSPRADLFTDKGAVEEVSSSLRSRRDGGRPAASSSSWPPPNVANRPAAASSSATRVGRLPRDDHTRKKVGDHSGPNKTDAAHILSFELANHIIRAKPGKKFGEKTQHEISASLNANDNLREKSINGNRVIDKSLDSEIIAASKNGALLSAPAASRARAVSRILMNSKNKLPQSVIETGHGLLSPLRDQDNHVIVRSNAASRDAGGASRRTFRPEAKSM